jgi:sulfur-oxidizing protein SoxZ
MVVAEVRRLLELGAARVLVPTTIHQGDVIDVRALVEHPMHTGLFRDPDGHPIPAHFINDVSVTYGEREVAHFVWTSGISRDPFVQFSLRADREAELRFTWQDNRGGVYRQAVDLKFAT